MIRADFNPWFVAAEEALLHVGEREVTPNHSPFIGRIWSEIDIGAEWYEKRSAWCCAFVCWSLLQASKRNKLLVDFPKTASVEAFDDWAHHNALRVPFATARMGDVVSFRPHFSHIGFVVAVGPEALVTVEGNTGDSGGREGDGVYRKLRDFSIVGSVWALPVRAASLS